MNRNTRTLLAGAAATLGLLAGLTACGTDTVSETSPGVQPGQVAHHSSGHASISADAAERQALENKQRAERADALRAAQGRQHEIKLRRSRS